MKKVIFLALALLGAGQATTTIEGSDARATTILASPSFASFASSENKDAVIVGIDSLTQISWSVARPENSLLYSIQRTFVYKHKGTEYEFSIYIQYLGKFALDRDRDGLRDTAVYRGYTGQKLGDTMPLPSPKKDLLHWI